MRRQQPRAGLGSLGVLTQALDQRAPPPPSERPGSWDCAHWVLPPGSARTPGHSSPHLLATLASSSGWDSPSWFPPQTFARAVSLPGKLWSAHGQPHHIPPFLAQPSSPHFCIFVVLTLVWNFLLFVCYLLWMLLSHWDMFFHPSPLSGPEGVQICQLSE